MLFELIELASYLQQDLDTATAALARDMATSKVRRAVGPTRYDALDIATLGDLKWVAMDLAGRIYNARKGRVRSESKQVDDFQTQTTYAVDDAPSIDLTTVEVAEVRQIAGLSSAFSITPAWPTTRAVCSESW